MIVTFTTRVGSKFHIDHDNNLFVRELPTERSGPLWNKPTVVIGQPVEIWTAPLEPGGTPRVIVTGVVVTREVTNLE